jgi:hypothetical protein
LVKNDKQHAFFQSKVKKTFSSPNFYVFCELSLKLKVKTSNNLNNQFEKLQTAKDL